jgi:hypothetical protein
MSRKIKESINKNDSGVKTNLSIKKLDQWAHIVLKRDDRFIAKKRLLFE